MSPCCRTKRRLPRSSPALNCRKLARFWKAAHGWAPIEAAGLLSKARLDWQVSLSSSLRNWLRDPPAALSDGDLILAWTNLGALIEGTLKLFLSVYYNDFQADVENLKAAGALMNDRKAKTPRQHIADRTQAEEPGAGCYEQTVKLGNKKRRATARRNRERSEAVIAGPILLPSIDTSRVAASIDAASLAIEKHTIRIAAGSESAEVLTAFPPFASNRTRRAGLRKLAPSDPPPGGQSTTLALPFCPARSVESPDATSGPFQSRALTNPDFDRALQP